MMTDGIWTNGWLRRGALAALAALSLSLGSFALIGAPAADAAGTVSAQLGVGCSSSSVSGASLRFNLRANSNLDVFVQHVTLTVNGSTVSDSGAISTHSYSKQVSVPEPTGSYSIVMTVSTDDLPDVTKTATANVVVTAHSVSCSVHSP